MKIEMFINFLKKKNEHYPITDDFVIKYHQKSGGYIENAQKANISINFDKGEPNQKWHFLESYVNTRDDRFYLRTAKDVYLRLLCPELKLWIAEATGVDESLVRSVANEVKDSIDINGDRNDAARNIINVKIPWEMIEDKMLENLNHKKEGDENK